VGTLPAIGQKDWGFPHPVLVIMYGYNVCVYVQGILSIKLNPVVLLTRFANKKQLIKGIERVVFHPHRTQEELSMPSRKRRCKMERKKNCTHGWLCNDSL
jgi:hypothetical protein